MLDLIPEKTIHPPLGLLTVAALCPKNWKLKLVNRSFEDSAGQRPSLGRPRYGQRHGRPER